MNNKLINYKKNIVLSIIFLSAPDPESDPDPDQNQHSPIRIFRDPDPDQNDTDPKH